MIFYNPPTLTKSTPPLRSNPGSATDKHLLWGDIELKNTTGGREYLEFNGIEQKVLMYYLEII